MAIKGKPPKRNSVTFVNNCISHHIQSYVLALTYRFSNLRKINAEVKVWHFPVWPPPSLCEKCHTFCFLEGRFPLFQRNKNLQWILLTKERKSPFSVCSNLIVVIFCCNILNIVITLISRVFSNYWLQQFLLEINLQISIATNPDG